MTEYVGMAVVVFLIAFMGYLAGWAVATRVTGSQRPRNDGGD